MAGVSSVAASLGNSTPIRFHLLRSSVLTIRHRVCAKKQRELTRAIKRARVMNLLPYMHKLPEFVRKDYVNPLLSDS